MSDSEYGNNQMSLEDEIKLVEVTIKKLRFASGKKQYKVLKEIWEKLNILGEIIQVIFDQNNNYIIKTRWKTTELTSKLKV